MSSPLLARYDFLSHYRRGAAGRVTQPDPLQGPLPARATLPVDLNLRSSAGAESADDPISTRLALYGPGDVVGLDPRQVIRTDPPDGTTSFEPSYFPAIEFDHPELPWLFTPAGPRSDRLRPWLVLVALTDDEYTLPERAPDPLPVVQVASAAVLPRLEESWAWAHAQVAGGLDGESVESLQASQPARVLSRILCPRRLTPLTRYGAFLVPAFELGVRAGLGEDVSSPPGGQTRPAWTATQSGAVLLPVYHRFSFQTSERGDFESLVRALVPRILPPEVGTRPMAVDQPGWGLPSAGGPLGLMGALKSLQTEETPWEDPERSAFQSALAAEVNRGAGPLDDPAQDPVVTPPLYGRWPAATAALDPSRPGWLDVLNRDPRHRAAAGMGSSVVLDQRNHLLHGAWQQAEGIRRANQLIRQSQLAVAASQLVLEKHIASAAPASVLSLTQPLHPRLLASPGTVAATLADSAVPARALSSAFRRVARPGGPVRRRQGLTWRAGDALGKLAGGALTPLPPFSLPGGMVALDDSRPAPPPREPPAVAADGGPERRAGWIAARLGPRRALGLGLGSVALALTFVVLLLLAGPLVAALVTAGAAAAGAAAWRRTGPSPPGLPRQLRPPPGALGGVLTEDHLTPEAFQGAPPRPELAISPEGPVKARPGRGPASDSPTAAAFRAAAVQLTEALAVPPEPEPARPPIALATLAGGVVERLAPAKTVPARVAPRIRVKSGVATIAWNPDRLDEIGVGPDFPQPMYEPLRDLDQELLLPGLELIPKDTLGLLLENRPFLESYMVGLNHELVRVLDFDNFLWLDRRWTCFRQFWDVRGYVARPTDPRDPAALRELLKDVPPIHRWDRPTELGSHRNRTDVAAGLVLLVRGDLLRRYPDTAVYACDAVWNPALRRRDLADQENRRDPLFRGTLAPDITFFGFDITREHARGSDGQSGPQGVFFVFQQNPTRQHFGLEAEYEPFSQPPVSEWSDLTWGHLVSDAAALEQLRYVSPVAPLHGAVVPTTNPDGSNPGDVDNRWGTDAAQMAFITMRRPVRVAVHARLMLPRA